MRNAKESPSRSSLFLGVDLDVDIRVRGRVRWILITAVAYAVFRGTQPAEPPAEQTGRTVVDEGLHGQPPHLETKPATKTKSPKATKKKIAATRRKHLEPACSPCDRRPKLTPSESDGLAESTTTRPDLTDGPRDIKAPKAR